MSFPYLWAIAQSDARDVLWVPVKGMLAVFSLSRKGVLMPLCLPFGPGGPEQTADTAELCLRFCEEHNGKNDSSPHIKLLNEDQLAFLKQAKNYSARFRSVMWVGIERHYDVQKLAALKGKEFAKLRGRINKFVREHPNAVFSRALPEDYEELIALGERWKQTSGRKYSNVFDTVYYREILRRNDELGQITYAMRDGGRIVGMVSGDVLPTGNAWGSLVKFDEGFPGLSETLIIDFCRELVRVSPHVRLLNVGSDLGSGGLREYKLKFHPALNLKRYMLYLRHPNTGGTHEKSSA